MNFTEYLSKDTKNWRRADMLLFTYNITHIHLTTKNGNGTNVELIFGIFKEDTFYALWFGDHHDLYNPKKLFFIAEKNWPDQLFKKKESITEDGDGDGDGDGRFIKRWANDPSLHFNLITPSGHLDGHQHTNLTKMTEEGEKNDGGIDNVPLHIVMAYNNEEFYLRNIEDNAASKYGVDARFSLDINLKERVYTVRLRTPCTLSLPVEKHPFPEIITCSNLAADHIYNNDD